jgi:predicted N-formylglutamate amidohydrolase
VSGRPLALVLTCEHASPRVPPPFAGAIAPGHAWLRSHRGFDAGAPALARHLAHALRAPLVSARFTRLLVDPNRSPDNPAVFSRFTRGLPAAVRARLLARLHRPHWAAVTRRVLAATGRGRTCLHVAVHSFTPVLRGARRAVDVGLLFDPARPGERAFAARWRRALRASLPDLRVRDNQPYAGASDGLPTALRHTLDAGRYLGFELEINQRLVRGPAARWRAVQRGVAAALAAALAGAPRATRRARRQ